MSMLRDAAVNKLFNSILWLDNDIDELLPASVEDRSDVVKLAQVILPYSALFKIPEAAGMSGNYIIAS